MSEQFLALQAKNARLTAGAQALDERVTELEGRLGEREEELRRLKQQRRQQLREEEIAEERKRIAEEEERTCREAAVAAAVAAPSCGRLEVKEWAAGILTGNGAAPTEEESEPIIPPPPAKKRGVSLLSKYFLAKDGEDGTDGCGKAAKTAPSPAAEDLDAAPSLTLEIRSYAAASALKAAISKTGRKGVLLDRLYKINESADRVHANQAESTPKDDADQAEFAPEDDANADANVDVESCSPAPAGTLKPPATGISPSLHKLAQFGREDSGPALDDAATEPTATISGEESEKSDTMYLLLEARSEVSLVQRRAAAVGRAGGRGVGGGAILDRILHKASAASAPAARAGTIDLNGVRRREISVADRWGDHDTSIQVGKEIYVTNSKVACGGKEQPVQASLAQVLPFSSPTLRF